MTELNAARALWDTEALTFDEAPDHCLLEPGTRAAWRALLLEHLPPAPASIADLGCGTGTLSLLLAEEGYAVHGLDLSPEMIKRAEAKRANAAELDLVFTVGDASAPDLAAGEFDVVLSRHVLWALPDATAGLRRWSALLKPNGRLVLVEGSWSTGAGLTAAQTTELLAGIGRTCTVRHLPEPVYWGRAIEDERYLVVSLT